MTDGQCRAKGLAALQNRKRNAVWARAFKLEIRVADMQESTVTASGQTTLPKDVRAALHLQAGDRLRYLLADGKVRLLRARSILDLEGALKRPGQTAVSLDQMQDVLAAGAIDQAQ